MNKNYQNPFANQQNTSQVPISDPNQTTLNQTSILRTEENNHILQGSLNQPSVASNSMRNTFNKISINFSFNNPKRQSSIKDTLAVKITNINNEKNINNEDSYKLLIKRIAMQLKKKVRQPTHGFFFFSMLKGSYPLVIIKKIETQIINHSIDLNSDIFRVYSEKYVKYKELVKKIALLLKQNMKNKMFWENEKYNQVNSINNNQSIQVKVTEKNKPQVHNNQNQKKNNIKSNLHIQNKKIDTSKNIKITQNKKGNNANHINANVNVNVNNQKKNKSQAPKINNNNINQTTSTTQNRNNVSHRINSVINPFNAAKIQNQKKINLTKKNDKNELNNKNNLISNKSVKNIKINNNIKNQNHSVSSETNKTAKVKFENINKPIISNNANEKSQIAKINKITKKTIINSSDDIEMKEESNKITTNSLSNDANINNNINNEVDVNNKIIPENKRSSLNIDNNNIRENNEELNKTTIIRNSDVTNVSLNSITSPGRKLQIRLTTFHKFDNIPKLISSDNNIRSSSKKKSNIELNEINIDSHIVNDSNNITDEQISFVNKFNVFMSNNGIIIDNNIPISNDINGQNYLLKSMFWEKYLHYLYLNYKLNKTKVSLFSFVNLIEQYFLWCETPCAESVKYYKELIIEIITKIFNEKDINKFLSMNKIKSLDALFNKYEVFMKYGNKDSFKKNKEVEIKIDNSVDCNCALCQSDIACIKKIGEMNKKLNTNVNIENILIKGEKKNMKNIAHQELQTENNYRMAFNGLNKSGVFSKSKTSYSFESVYQYFPPKIIEEENKEEKISKSKSKSKSKKRSSTNKMKKDENKDNKYIDRKIEEFVNKEEIDDIVNEVSDIIVKEEKNKSRKKSEKKNKIKKKINISKYYDDSCDESDINNRKRNDSSEESDEFIAKKEKAKKKKKSKSRNKRKSVNRKNRDSDSETEIESENDSEEENIRKKKVQYPKVGKKKGKKHI